MFPRIWLKPSLRCFFLLPLSWIYGLVTILNRISYQCGWRKICKYAVPIIIVGNITVGGNGKTPIVLWLIEQLVHRGWKVGIVSRGYKGKSNNYPIILNANSSVDECGDEPILIWRRTKTLVAVAPKRTDAITELLKMQSLDIIISDDGLQHYALYRDIEWVVVNHEIRFGNGYWIPAGPMRERITRLNKVQAVIINGFKKTKLNPGEILMRSYPSSIINLLTGERRSPISFFGKIVVAIAGIGNPIQFFTILQKLGIILIRTMSFSDHYIYNKKILHSLIKKNEILFMTEKDAVKCFSFAHENWWYVRIDVKINKSDTKRLLYMVEKKIKSYKINRSKIL